VERKRILEAIWVSYRVRVKMRIMGSTSLKYTHLLVAGNDTVLISHVPWRRYVLYGVPFS